MFKIDFQQDEETVLIIHILADSENKIFIVCQSEIALVFDRKKDSFYIVYDSSPTPL
jgi:hypothetical protein